MRANFYSNKSHSDEDRYAVTTENGFTQQSAFVSSVPVNSSISNLKVLRQGLSVQVPSYENEKI